MHERLLRFFIFEIRAWIEAFIRFIPGMAGTLVRRYWYKKRLKRCSKVVIGTGCEFLSPESICADGLVNIGKGGFFSAEGGAIFIGNKTSFNSNVHINASVGGTVQIGESCLIGPNVVMRTAGHRFDNPDVPICQQGHIIKDIFIEDNVWIGASAVILGGVRIGAGAVIGAGSVVSRNIASMTVAVGVPAKVIKNRHL